MEFVTDSCQGEGPGHATQGYMGKHLGWSEGVQNMGEIWTGVFMWFL